jgi:putative oxidoreductase
MDGRARGFGRRRGKGVRIGGLVVRGLLVALFLAAAGMKLAAVPFEAESFARFGYAPWFMTLVGLVQLAGAVLLVRRGTVFLGAGLLALVMVGAVASHLRAGDPLPIMLPAIVTLAALVALAWSRRAALRLLRMRMRIPALA